MASPRCGRESNPHENLRLSGCFPSSCRRRSAGHTKTTPSPSNPDVRQAGQRRGVSCVDRIRYLLLPRARRGAVLTPRRWQPNQVEQHPSGEAPGCRARAPTLTGGARIASQHDSAVEDKGLEPFEASLQRMPAPCASPERGGRPLLYVTLRGGRNRKNTRRTQWGGTGQPAYRQG